MMDLHGQMMNLQCRDGDALNGEFSDRRTAYKTGHRDARHAAAELALLADSERDELLTVARMIDAHYSGSLDHQPAYVKLARTMLTKYDSTALRHA